MTRVCGPLDGRRWLTRFRLSCGRGTAEVAFDRLTHEEAIARDLKVMDAAAFALARENRLPIIVFAAGEAGSIPAVVCGAGRSTLVAC